MESLEERQETMQRDVLLVATAGLSLLNGMPFSPLMGDGVPGPIEILLRPFLAGTFLGHGLVFFYIVSLFCSVLTVILAGIPAAIYERAKGLDRSSPVSLGIWLLGVLALVVLPHVLLG